MQVIFVIQTYFWMTTGDSDVESESPFSYLKVADEMVYRKQHHEEKKATSIISDTSGFRMVAIRK